MATLTITRNYEDGEILTEADLDAICDSVETFLNSTKINDDNIQNAGITASDKLISGSISTAKLADLSVTTAKINDLAVTAGKIAADAVTTAKILDANVTTAKIADANVTRAKLAEGAVGRDALTAVKTTTYTATTSDDVVRCDTSGGAWTLTLFSAASLSGRRLTIIKTTSDFSVLTVDGNGAETIGGSATTTLNSQGEELVIESDGTNWIVVSRVIPSVWTSATFVFSAGFGSVTGQQSFVRRVGDSLQARIYAVSGTVTAAGAAIQLPSSLTIDTNKMATGLRSLCGQWVSYRNLSGLAGNSLVGPVVFDPGSTSNVQLSNSGDGTVLQTMSVNAYIVSTQGFGVEFTVPISGWNG